MIHLKSSNSRSTSRKERETPQAKIKPPPPSYLDGPLTRSYHTNIDNLEGLWYSPLPRPALKQKTSLLHQHHLPFENVHALSLKDAYNSRDFKESGGTGEGHFQENSGMHTTPSGLQLLFHFTRHRSTEHHSPA